MPGGAVTTNDLAVEALTRFPDLAAPVAASRLAEASERIGPVWQQIHGQTETVAMGTTHQAPRSIGIVEALPLTPVAKIDKKVPRAPYPEGRS